jgi:hypothetical protein
VVCGVLFLGVGVVVGGGLVGGEGWGAGGILRLECID